ncbi:MAG TPA: hypothetical protein VM010_05590, partial [Chitinophagaceae bacterium]|nr:hypothetical protein [Chitinophagaceae bacterium]
QTLKFKAEKSGIYPFYCTDFCSALHQEMQGYLRVSPAGSNVALLFSTGKNLPAVTAQTDTLGLAGKNKATSSR